jgi:probable HAF family extracellular repeat protein
MKTLIVIIGLITTAISYASITYSVVDLGTLGGNSSRAMAINATGQIVGLGHTSSGTQQAFLYSNGVMQDIDNSTSIASIANDINNSGEIVGSTYHSTGQHAFSYSGGIMTDIYLGTGLNTANGINNIGQIVGNNTSAINNIGQAVGLFGDSRAFINSGGTTTLLPLISGGYYFNNATDINDHSQVVGYMESVSGYGHAFLYSNGATIDLGTLGGGQYSGSFGLNNLGQVVGWSQLSNLTQHSFLYTDGVMWDLDYLTGSDTGWQFKEATDINDLGQIVGYGINPLGQEHAFLLNPIPEPSAPVFLFVTATGILFRRRR